MQASDVARAVAAPLASAGALDLMVNDTIVLQNANRLVLRLLPCDAVARVANVVHQPGAAFEVELAQRHSCSVLHNSHQNLGGALNVMYEDLFPPERVAEQSRRLAQALIMNTLALLKEHRDLIATNKGAALWFG